MLQVKERGRNPESLANSDRCERASSPSQIEKKGSELPDTHQAAFLVLRSIVKGLTDHIDDTLLAVRREARMLFDALDLDRNGVLSYMELHTALDGLGFVQACAPESVSCGSLRGAREEPH